MMSKLFFTFIIILSFSWLSYSQDELSNEQILEMYEELRVADVSDAMDYSGLWNRGLMDQKISAIWKDYDKLEHIFRGIALTVRYVPTNEPLPGDLSKEEFNKWVGETYANKTPEPFVDHIKDGTVIVLDAGGNSDAGIAGSLNSLVWVSKGMVGLVASGGVRDTDEIAKQKIPVYMDWEKRGRGIRPGRNEFESMNEPVTIGGVKVYPGDVIVADGDGVIVVPRAFAKKVAEYAQEVLNKDKAGRRQLYENMEMELDQTVE